MCDGGNERQSRPLQAVTVSEFQIPLALLDTIILFDTLWILEMFSDVLKGRANSLMDPSSLR